MEGQRVGRDWVTEYTHLAIYDKKKKNYRFKQFLCEGYWDTEILLKAWASWWLRGKESACNWSGNWFLCWSIQWVWSLGWEDPLEKEMTTHSNILAWIIPRTEEPGGRQSRGSQRVGHNWVTNTHTHTHTQILMDPCLSPPCSLLSIQSFRPTLYPFFPPPAFFWISFLYLILLLTNLLAPPSPHAVSWPVPFFSEQKQQADVDAVCNQQGGCQSCLLFPLPVGVCIIFKH